MGIWSDLAGASAAPTTAVAVGAVAAVLALWELPVELEVVSGRGGGYPL